MTYYKKITKELNRLANTSHKRITFILGNKKPKLVGESGYYTTISGKTLISYPNAYHYPMTYHKSTIKIEVGIVWFTNYKWKKKVVN